MRTKDRMNMGNSKSTASDSFATALRLLTRSDRSETELRQKLKQVGFSVTAIAAAIAKCRDYNYLNDNRYARERARTLMRSGRGVGTKIIIDMRRRGIDESTAQKALETAESEFSTDQILREQLTRRFSSFSYSTANDRERSHVIGFFQRRGFPLEQIFEILKENRNYSA